MRGLPVSTCSNCGHAVFPARLLCPRCGGSGWTISEVDDGVVEDATVVRRAPGGPLPASVSLGTVRVEGGILVPARIEPGAEPGARVRVEYRDGILVAHRSEV
jgi:uncharacterized OB-fold protein